MKERCPIPWRVRLADGRQIGGLRWAGHGRPLILIHGLFDSAEGWAEVARGLHGPIVAFDLPGFGRSDAPTKAEASFYATDLLEALDLLRIRRARIAGHSLGGAIASEMCAIEPDRFDELVLIAPAGYGRLQLAKFFDLPVIAGISSGIIRGSFSVSPLVEAVYRYAVVGGKKPQGDLINRVRGLGPYVPVGVRSAVHALSLAGGRSGLGLQRGFYEGPVTCVWGEGDRMIPRSHIEELEKVLPQAEIRIWPDVAHHPQAEVPELVRSLLEEGKNPGPLGRLLSATGTFF